MKIWSILLLVVSTFFLHSCVDDKCTQTSIYTMYEPIYVDLKDVLLDAEIQAPKDIVNPGKMYYYHSYIFINEVNEGIHFINNIDPSNPINESFLAINGNVDLAIMNDYLYADSYTDLLVIDMHDLKNPKQIDRQTNVFNNNFIIFEGKILSHYEETEKSFTTDCNNPNWGNEFYTCGDNSGGIYYDKGFAASNGSGVLMPSQVGQGGSLARFTISHNHLYLLDNINLISAEISNDGLLRDITKTAMPWGIETIFPAGENLFVGANNGLHILSIDDPSVPKLISTFQHARACDPVYVVDDLAYVTLRDGTTCQGYANQLDVVDVKNVLDPKLLYSFNMKHPIGLSINRNYLYLCEDNFGLKVFDLKDISTISDHQVGNYDGFQANDAISLDSTLLLVIGKDGFRQYDSTDPLQLKLLSTIHVQ